MFLFFACCSSSLLHSNDCTAQQLEDSRVDLIVAGIDNAVLMTEGFCDFLAEEQMLEVKVFLFPPLLLFCFALRCSSLHYHQKLL